MKNDHEPTPEMEKKLNGCTSAEDVRELMDAEDIELSPGDLEKVSGGRIDYDMHNGIIHTVYNEVVTVNGEKYFKLGDGSLSKFVYELARWSPISPDDDYDIYQSYLYFLPDGTYTSCYACDF